MFLENEPSSQSETLLDSIGLGIAKKQATRKHGGKVTMAMFGTLRGRGGSYINLYNPIVTTVFTAAILGETCAVPNDDTLVGKADEKVNERHSPQTGTNPGHPGLGRHPGLGWRPGLGWCPGLGCASVLACFTSLHGP